MRICSFNILDGGVGRADPLAEIIEAQHPDVVALIEADNIDVLERIAGRLKMDYIRAAGPGDHAVAILSRWAIVHSINHALLRAGPRCLVEALIRQPDGTEWVIGAVHCRPGAMEEEEAEREREVAALLEIFQPHRQGGRPHILAGDFNANSPIQRIDPAKSRQRTREAWEKNGGQIPRRAVSAILGAGYLDSLHAVAGEAATTAGSFCTQYPQQRVDYLFTFGLQPARLRQAWIEQDRLAQFASDHFPIGLEID